MYNGALTEHGALSIGELTTRRRTSPVRNTRCRTPGLKASTVISGAKIMVQDVFPKGKTKANLGLTTGGGCGAESSEALESRESKTMTFEELCAAKREKVDGRTWASAAGSNSGIQKGGDITVHTTFGLENEAEAWLRDQLKGSQGSYLRQPTNAATGANVVAESPAYTPFQCNQDVKIPMDHLQEAFAEFVRRYGSLSSSDKSPSVLLVATGVSEDWLSGHDVGSARFLFFPKLGLSNKTALFITYMRGPEHGSVDKQLASQITRWEDANRGLSDYLTGGLSSGGRLDNRFNGFEPDHRLFPRPKYRDPNGNDSDGSNKGNPYSRFIWEIEVGNRDPIEIRQRGKLYMKNEYTRLFLAAKFYAPLDDGTYEAAIVLWGKPDGSNDTTVMDAVSFGTSDLSDEYKNDFLEQRANRLVGVQLNQWRRPQFGDPASWTVRVPFFGIGYKVAKKIKKRKKTRSIVYVLDEIEGDAVQDLIVDLLDIKRYYEGQVLPAEELSEVSSSEDDDN